MDILQEKSARKLVHQLERHGSNCGLLVVQGNVVIRFLRAEPTDAPAMAEEADLQNAIALGLLEKHKVTGSFEWEWYLSKRIDPRSGDSIILADGTRRTIEGFEKGIAFYGKGSNDIVPLENLVPASNADPNCWEVDSSR